ncbi:hypothetical protein [Mucilaginibacter sp. UR6-11]|uniref:hypothetical protein n=1 Tax=Mucilaginibacter sp. UR6-11 TaxID=1435644 RepID=UPI001E6123CA|nr:hypothetical protein [Mucilaginibacter sp. UR6-11]MCC8425795.1 hypothetical protein [Mucilaginibacter sp. UR6-11]
MSIRTESMVGVFEYGSASFLAPYFMAGVFGFFEEMLVTGGEVLVNSLPAFFGDLVVVVVDG